VWAIFFGKFFTNYQIGNILGFLKPGFEMLGSVVVVVVNTKTNMFHHIKRLRERGGVAPTWENYFTGAFDRCVSNARTILPARGYLRHPVHCHRIRPLCEFRRDYRSGAFDSRSMNISAIKHLLLGLHFSRLKEPLRTLCPLAKWFNTAPRASAQVVWYDTPNMLVVYPPPTL
jgi:hypothetical protein